MKSKRLYLLLGLACAAGYLYLFYAASTVGNETGFGPCMFKNVTGIPCPSCGSTRSVLLLVSGEPLAALLLNPLGIVLAAGLIIVPIWLCLDLFRGKRTLHAAWTIFERRMKTPGFAILVFGLIAINWIWNIFKDL